MTGWQKSWLHTRSGKRSASLRELYRECSGDERRLSVEFYERYPAGRGTGLLTPLAGVLQAPGPLAGGADLVNTSDDSDLYACLARALGGSLPGVSDVAVAVSGGIDCWLLAAILQAQGYRVRGWYLESGIAGYCEREQVERMSEALGIECRSIRVTAGDFVESAAEFVAVTETPIYNLHPVSKWLLAKGLRDEGITTVVTGDGADQVMRWDWDCDLLPLTMACFRSAGIRLVTPFATDEVIGFCRQPYPDKQPIRDLARELGVPAVAKHPTLFPAVKLPSQPHAELPAVCESQTSCLSYTTGLLLQALEEAARCAESRV
jgi:PP-loop superfamily ATP-utilizing enzyme